MEKSINSPISDDYSPKAETAETIKSWITDGSTKYSSTYTFSVFLVSPLISYVLIAIAVCYYNHLAENCRITRIKEKLDSKMEAIIANCKYDLQNEYLLSLLFVIYALVLSCCGMGFTDYTNKILNEEYVTKYYKFQNGGRLYFATNLIETSSILDGFVLFAFIAVQIFIALLKLKCSCCKSKIDDMWFWKFCAYSVIFPLCTLANHFHYIIIAFIHDVYHATGVALVYGILIIIIYEALVQLPKILIKLCEIKRKCSCPRCFKKKRNSHSGNISQRQVEGSGGTADSENMSPAQVENSTPIEDLETTASENNSEAQVENSTSMHQGEASVSENIITVQVENVLSIQGNETGAESSGSNQNCCTKFLKNLSCGRNKSSSDEEDNNLIPPHTQLENTAESLDSNQNCVRNSEEQASQSDKTSSYHYEWIFVLKIILLVILIGYFLYNMLIYYYLPINKAFDDATNHLIGLYQAITVIFAAFAAYLFFNREQTSPISVFTKAEYEHGVLKGKHCSEWENITAQKRDNIMAKELLKLLKNMKPSLDNTQGDNPGGNPEIREIEQS